MEASSRPEGRAAPSRPQAPGAEASRGAPPSPTPGAVPAGPPQRDGEPPATTPTGFSMTAPPAPGVPSAARWGGEPGDEHGPGRPDLGPGRAGPPQAAGPSAGPSPSGLLTGAQPQTPPPGTRRPHAPGGAPRDPGSDGEPPAASPPMPPGPRPGGPAPGDAGGYGRPAGPHPAPGGTPGGGPARPAPPGTGRPASHPDGGMAASERSAAAEPDTRPVRAYGGDAEATAPVAGEEPGARPADAADGQGRAKRRRGLPGPARFAMLGVAAVVAGAATVGVQMWDRSLWVAERYPAESVREARAGETVSRWGVRWTVEVTRVPRTNKPGRVMLQVTVRLTPENQKAIDDFVPPNVEFRDTAGRTWVTIVPPEGSVYRSDLKVGRTARMTAYGVVPEELADTAKVALVSTGESADVLLFSR